MAKSPIIKTMDEMLVKLKEATHVQRVAQKNITEYTNAIRALAQVCEDEEVKNEYLLILEELGGKPGFVDAIRSVLRGGTALTPTEIRQMIVLTGKLSLSGYSNPMASIHTTLRRMKDSGEIEEVQNSNRDRAYRFHTGSHGISQHAADAAASEFDQRIAEGKKALERSALSKVSKAPLDKK